MIKVNLLALTGFGNIALKTLMDYKGNVKIMHLYTRKEKNEFPYYKERNIASLATDLGIDSEYIPCSGKWSIKDSVDINLIVTFHRILKERHLKKALFNINIHPSLLPSYRGPTPTNWMIYNNEKVCGLTAHILTKKIDEGPFILQKSYRLSVKADALLRRFLALKVEGIVRSLIKDYPNYKVIKSPYQESCYPSFYNTLKRA